MNNSLKHTEVEVIKEMPESEYSKQNTDNTIPDYDRSVHQRGSITNRHMEN